MRKFNICLVGPIGTGKTWSTRTLVKAGLTPVWLAVEPGVGNQVEDIPCPTGHFKYISPATTSWAEMIKGAKFVNTLSMKGLQDLSVDRSGYQQFIHVMEALSDFTCDRCGENLGPVDDWGPEKALVLDGLSGLSQMAMHMTVGPKVIRTQPEWGAAMNSVLYLIRKLCYNTTCTFVLISHMDRETDILNGGTVKTISTLGVKLAPELIKPFDEVICTLRRKNKFSWSTVEMDIDLKDRVLGWRDDLEPDFSQFPFHEDNQMRAVG